MSPLVLLVLLSVSHSCLGRPQQQQGAASMAEIQAHGPMLDQGSDHHQGISPVRVQQRDIIHEPSCDELKAMWRFSKRQARAPEIINEISSYKDPFAMNEWAPYYSAPPTNYISSARSSGGGARFRNGMRHNTPVFGRVISRMPVSSPPALSSQAGKGFDQVARLFGTIHGPPSDFAPRVRTAAQARLPPQTGRFQHLKEIIRTERARELQQQRAAEELAARAAALKDIAGNSFPLEHKHSEYMRPGWGTSPNMINYSDEPSYYHTTKDNSKYNSEGNKERPQSEGVITYPDLSAPSRRSGMWQIQSQRYVNRRGNNGYDEQDQPIMINRRSGQYFPSMPVDPDSGIDDYILDPVMLDDSQMLLDPLFLNLHNLDKALLDGHTIRRPETSHYLFN